MAKLIPAYDSVKIDALSKSERHVLQALHELDFPGLEVYFSFHLLSERKKGTFRGEADFVLFHPQHGLLVWEVKGGGISLEDPIKQTDKAIGIEPTLCL